MQANRMNKLLDKIERRLGVKQLNLPDYLTKDKWAEEVIANETLDTFSRYFPNSMHIRICLKMLDVLYEKAMISDNPQDELVQMEKYILQAKSLDELHSYEKYAIGVELLSIKKSYLDITLMKRDTDYLTCIKRLKDIMERTEDNNVNLYQIAEETLQKFQEI